MMDHGVRFARQPRPSPNTQEGRGATRAPAVQHVPIFKVLLLLELLALLV